MFAYCNNDPVMYDDQGGYSRECDACYIAFRGGEVAVGVGNAGGIGLIPLIYHAANVTIQALRGLTREVYEFSKSVVDDSAERYANHQPRVHHVIPAGDFSSRNYKAQTQISDMHNLLSRVGIDINDPENLLVMSHGTHKSFHGNEYIDSIHKIMMTAKNGDEWDVRFALFLARIYASSYDAFPNGY